MIGFLELPVFGSRLVFDFDWPSNTLSLSSLCSSASVSGLRLWLAPSTLNLASHCSSAAFVSRLQGYFEEEVDIIKLGDPSQCKRDIMVQSV